MDLIRVFNFENLPDSALISVREFNLITGRSHSSTYRDIKNGRLPKPVKIGAGASRFRVADVKKYVAGIRAEAK